MLNCVTINSINDYIAGDSYFREDLAQQKVAKKLVKKCIEHHKRVKWVDFSNFYHINYEKDINCCGNLDHKERKAYEKICQIMGVKAKNTKIWDNNGYPGIRWAR